MSGLVMVAGYNMAARMRLRPSIAADFLHRRGITVARGENDYYSPTRNLISMPERCGIFGRGGEYVHVHEGRFRASRSVRHSAATGTPLRDDVQGRLIVPKLLVAAATVSPRSTAWLTVAISVGRVDEYRALPDALPAV